MPIYPKCLRNGIRRLTLSSLLGDLLAKFDRLDYSNVTRTGLAGRESWGRADNTPQLRAYTSESESK